MRNLSDHGRFMKNIIKCFIIILGCLFFAAIPCISEAASASVVQKHQTAGGLFDGFMSQGPKGMINIVIILTILSFIPAILLLMSAFTRIVIVLSFIRQAIGIQQLPPNQVIIGLSLFLTFFVMAPTYDRIYTSSLGPYLENKISTEQFFESSTRELNAFMLKYTKDKDLALFINASGMQRPKKPEDVPTYILVPAFAIGELKRAFQIGFLLYIPFLIIDMVIASVLLSAGMMMLPPVFISLPFKLMLFVLVDGWNLLVGSLIRGF